MKPIVQSDEDLLVSNEKSLRGITLNRPRAMNALTLDMVVEIYDLLRSWASDPDVKVVMLDGAGERGLCAGGDVRALYNAARTGTDLPHRFWKAEYRLDALIARYPKPVVAIMDGIVMGGGVGISAYASHRVGQLGHFLKSNRSMRGQHELGNAQSVRNPAVWCGRRPVHQHA